MWTGAVTNVGVALLSKWAAGGTLTITRAQGASGQAAEAELANQSTLTNPMQALSIAGYKTDGTGVTYKIQILSNTTEYTLRQIGVFGRLGNGAETLLAIYQDPTGLTVPSSAEANDFVLNFSATVQMGNTGSLDVTVDTNALVTQSAMEAYVDAALAGIDLKELDQHIGDKGNPHAVTTEQIGAAKATHQHGGITNDGRIGTQADKLVKTGEGGVLETVSYEDIRDGMNITPAGIGAAKAVHAHGNIDNNGSLGAGNANRMAATDAEGKLVAKTASEARELIGAAASTHNQSASTITSGTLAGQVKASPSAEAALSAAQVRNIYAGTDDLVEGESALTNGEVYLVYE